MTAESTPLVLAWMDLEMTGLSPDHHAIVEVALVITGADFVPRESVEQVVWQPPSALQDMEPVVVQMHTENGLLERIPHGVPLRQAERVVLDVLRRHAAPGEAILAGNSIHTDRLFLSRYMPGVERYLHYRHFDATSIRQFMLTSAPHWEAPPPSTAGKNHRAMSDVQAALHEMTHYRGRVQQTPKG